MSTSQRPSPVASADTRLQASKAVLCAKRAEKRRGIPNWALDFTGYCERGDKRRGAPPHLHQLLLSERLEADQDGEAPHKLGDEAVRDQVHRLHLSGGGARTSQGPAPGVPVSVLRAPRWAYKGKGIPRWSTLWALSGTQGSCEEGMGTPSAHPAPTHGFQQPRGGDGIHGLHFAQVCTDGGAEANGLAVLPAQLTPHTTTQAGPKPLGIRGNSTAQMARRGGGTRCATTERGPAVEGVGHP